MDVDCEAMKAEGRGVLVKGILSQAQVVGNGQVRAQRKSTPYNSGVQKQGNFTEWS